LDIPSLQTSVFRFSSPWLYNCLRPWLSYGPVDCPFTTTK
jgi:hypothetical protein